MSKHQFIIHYSTDSLGTYKDAVLTLGKEYLVLNTVKTFTEVYYAILDDVGSKVVVKKLLGS